jgi:hypothetical protein
MSQMSALAATLCEIQRPVVAPKRGAVDVDGLPRDCEYLMILSPRRVKEIDRSLAYE